MDKLIVTHFNPDPDAITSVWLFRRFHPQFTQSAVEFVPAGNTYQGQPADNDPNIIHVDTGEGQFDHHQRQDRTCAAGLILEYLQSNFQYLQDDEALERLVEIIIGDDHFEDCFWPEPTADRYSFMFGEILDGLKRNNTLTDHGLIDFGSTCLDGIYTSLKLKLEAEKEIAKGQEFESKWGKALALETKNDEVLKLGLKMGYILVVRKDPDGMARIKAQPQSRVDLTLTYDEIKQADPEAIWYLHASKRILINGSYKNPHHVFSKLNLGQIVKILSK